MPLATEAGVYAFKSMEAGLYDPPIVAMRINSDIIRWTQQGNRTIKTKISAAPGDKYVGLVMLFSTITGEPLAMFPDGVVQRMRVASSSALAARYLAREDARTMALFGSGWQAGSHLPAMCAVRALKRVNVFSRAWPPTFSHKRAAGFQIFSLIERILIHFGLKASSISVQCVRIVYSGSFCGAEWAPEQ